MEDILIRLENADIEHISALSEELNIGNKIIFEEYISANDLLALIEEWYFDFERRKEIEEDMYSFGDEHDEVIERGLLENE